MHTPIVLMVVGIPGFFQLQKTPMFSSSKKSDNRIIGIQNEKQKPHSFMMELCYIA